MTCLERIYCYSRHVRVSVLGLSSGITSKTIRLSNVVVDATENEMHLSTTGFISDY
jgi:hypothetical protein